MTYIVHIKALAIKLLNEITNTKHLQTPKVVFSRVHYLCFEDTFLSKSERISLNHGGYLSHTAILLKIKDIVYVQCSNDLK